MAHLGCTINDTKTRKYSLLHLSIEAAHENA